MKIPHELFAHLDRDTPFCLCMGLYLCEPLCLELYTTEALLLAEQEADRLLSAAAVSRLRAMIVRRHLLAPRTPALLERLDSFLARFYPEGDPLRVSVRRVRASVRDRRPRPSEVWTGSGQKFLRRLVGEYETTDAITRKALLGLLLPGKLNDQRRWHEACVCSIPIAVSVREFVESRFSEAVRGHLRRGLCLRLEVEMDRELEPKDLRLGFEGAGPSEDVRRSAEVALDLLREESEDFTGRLVVRLPEVMNYISVEGLSIGLALYRAFRYAARSRECPPDVVVTGAIDPDSRRVMPIAGIEEKARAAAEEGAYRFFFPALGSGGTPPPKVEGVRLVGLNRRDPRGFLREVSRKAAPRHVRVAEGLKVALFFALAGASAPVLQAWSGFHIRGDAMREWIKGWAGSEALAEILYVGFGLPVQLLVLINPFLLFLLIYLALARQIECLVNWVNDRRWKPGLSPAGALSESLGARRFTGRERAFRTLFYFTCYWFFWFVGAGAFTFFYRVAQRVPRLPEGAGVGRVLLQIAVSVILIAALMAVPVFTIGAYRRVVKTLGRRFPVLK